MGARPSKDANHHYRDNHRGRPHEYLVRGIIPERQQKVITKNETAYIFLYLGIAVGAIMIVTIILALCRDQRNKKGWRKEVMEHEEKRKRAIAAKKIKEEEDKKKKEAEASSQSNLNSTTGTTSTSLPSMGTFRESRVQPPREPRYVPTPRRGSPTTVITVELSAEDDTRDDFGKYNHHQKYASPRYPDLHQHQQEGGGEPFATNNFGEQQGGPNPNPSTRSSSYEGNLGGDAGRPRPSLSREESFPFEQFGMGPENREPRRTRVENQRPISDFFRFAPGLSFMENDEEINEGSSGGGAGLAGPDGNLLIEVHARGGTNEEDAFGNADTLPLRESKKEKDNQGPK